jgi:hypothetical protein
MIVRYNLPLGVPCSMIPEKLALGRDRGWEPVSRLREALPTRLRPSDATAGEGRSEKIMSKSKVLGEHKIVSL